MHACYIQNIMQDNDKSPAANLPFFSSLGASTFFLNLSMVIT